MTEKLQKNIRKLYWYSFFQMFLVIMPVIVPFWQLKGLTLQQIFTLQGIFGFSLIVFDVPAGYIADLFGRKRALIIGSIFTALGFQILWLGQTYLHFVIYEIVVGLGISLQSGCDVAILYSSLEKLGLHNNRAQYLGKRLKAQATGEGCAALFGGLLAGVSLQWPAYINGVTAWLPVILSAFLYEPTEQKLTRESHFENFKSIGKALFGHSKLLTLLIFNFVFYGFATYCAVWSFQPYWKEQGVRLSYFGYLWALNSFATALMGHYAHAFEKKWGPVKSILVISVLPVIGYLGMGISGLYAGVLFSLAFPLCRGLNQVLFQDAINSRVPAEMRATTNSIGSLGMRMLFILFGPIIGSILDHKGASQVMIFMGAVYGVGTFAVAGALLSQRKHFRWEV